MAQVALTSITTDFHHEELLRVPSEEWVRTKKDESLKLQHAQDDLLPPLEITNAHEENEQQITISPQEEASIVLVPDAETEENAVIGSLLLPEDLAFDPSPEDLLVPEADYHLEADYYAPVYEWDYCGPDPDDFYEGDMSASQLAIEDIAEAWETSTSGRLYNHKRGGFTRRSTKATKIAHKIDADDLRARRRGRIHHSQAPERTDPKAWRVNMKQPTPASGLGLISINPIAPASYTPPPAASSSRNGRRAAKREKMEREALMKARQQHYVGGYSEDYTATTGTFDWGAAPPAAAPVEQQRPPARAQRFELRATTRASQRERLLEQLQYRELTPEDYDILLALDESVAPKTVSAQVVSSFETITYKEEMAGTLRCTSCAVCMGDFEAEQQIQRLPCKHEFHAECIQHWLTTASHICPIDGISLLPS